MSFKKKISLGLLALGAAALVGCGIPEMDEPVAGKAQELELKHRLTEEVDA